MARKLLINKNQSFDSLELRCSFSGDFDWLTDATFALPESPLVFSDWERISTPKQVQNLAYSKVHTEWIRPPRQFTTSRRLRKCPTSVLLQYDAGRAPNEEKRWAISQVEELIDIAHWGAEVTPQQDDAIEQCWSCIEDLQDLLDGVLRDVTERGGGQSWLHVVFETFERRVDQILRSVRVLIFFPPLVIFLKALNLFQLLCSSLSHACITSLFPDGFSRDRISEALDLPSSICSTPCSLESCDEVLL